MIVVTISVVIIVTTIVAAVLREISTAAPGGIR